MKKIVFIILIAANIVSCNQKAKFDFKFADQEQDISCSQTHDALLNEALYSFEDDIITRYDSINRNEVKAYGAYIYRGMDGSAKYDEVISSHSRPIANQLLEANILIKDKSPSRLNYAHPTVQCIIDNIENKDIKATIKSLIQINSMDPKLFSSRLRNVGRYAKKQRNLALYIALDSYYQRILDVTPQ